MQAIQWHCTAFSLQREKFQFIAPTQTSLYQLPRVYISKTKEVDLAAQVGGEVNLVFKTVERF